MPMLHYAIINAVLENEIGSSQLTTTRNFRTILNAYNNILLHEDVVEGTRHTTRNFVELKENRLLIVFNP